MMDDPVDKTGGSGKDYEIIAVFKTPWPGMTVSVDRQTLERKVLKHNQAWANLEQCRAVIEEPSDVFRSQHSQYPDRLMFYGPAQTTTENVKFVKVVADFSAGLEGTMKSIHPKANFGVTGPRVYPIPDAESTTDADV